MIKNIMINAQKTAPVVTYTELWHWGTMIYGEANDGYSTVLPYNIPGNYVSGSSGLSYTMAVKNDGTLWGWGAGGFGKLGDGGTTNRSSPVQIGTLTTWTDVQAGLSTTMAIKTDGTLWVWGHNTAFGMLGTGESISTSYSSPIQLGTDTNWKQVSQRVNHVGAVKTDGTLWMWGNGNVGQLGQGNTTSRSSPVQVGTLTNWSSVSVGQSYTLAVKTDGTLWGWGLNSNGRLGQNTTVNRSSPIQLGTDTNWKQVSAGNVSFAVKTDGTLWGWGVNTSYQLADGTNVDRSSPVQIGTLTNWSLVSVNAGTTRYNQFGIKTDGTLWTWGSTNNGGYGDGTFSQGGRSSPVQVGTLTNWNFINNAQSHTIARTSDGKVWTWGDTSNGANQLGYSTIRSSPVQIGTLTNWGGNVRAAGAQWTLANKQDGSLWGFGWNNEGELSQNNVICTAYPVSLPITVSSFTVGYSHTLAIKSDGTLWTWGRNSFGRLGDGTTIDRSSPIQVGSDTNWSKIAAGNASFAIKTTGTLWAWGDGINFGLTGQNDAVNRSSPVQVGTATDWSNVYMATNTVYAIKTDGTLWSWGRNDNGQVGDRTIITRSSPVQIGTLTNWANASYGGNATHGGAIKTDGTLWMWGRNNSGQLGLNDTTNRSSPVQVGTLTNWSKVTVSASNTVAIKTDGTLWVWGNGTTAGMNGLNDFVNRSSPVQLGTSDKWVDVWSGDSYTIAVKSYQ